jgi:NAD(P)-dependent dehydrogenase (short-subunit alcohol dehydrogenase family)
MIHSVPDVDILVNNLGVYEAKSFFDLRDSDWMSLFEINVMSGIRLARHYMRGMPVRAGSGPRAFSEIAERYPVFELSRADVQDRRIG